MHGEEVKPVQNFGGENCKAETIWKAWAYVEG